jgi:hypothetical protein
MTLLRDLKMYWRFGSGLRSFLDHTLSLEEARKIVERRMAERDKNFLRLVERGIFGYTQSPYLPLLKLAGCEFGDIAAMVGSKGLEATLLALRQAGAYVTFEEFKGTTPIVRQGKVIPVRAHDFDNPYLSRYYQVETGGTTGAGTRVEFDLDHLAAIAPLIMLTLDAHGILDVPTALWYGILPDSSGINNVLLRARFGRVCLKWFTPITKRETRSSAKYRWATEYIIWAARLCGIAVPRPEPVNLDNAVIVARWAAETLKSHGACMVRTTVSLALRVCVAAHEQGLNLRGAVFWGGSEPPTATKVKEMNRVGARYIPTYWFIEAGVVGLGCAQTKDVDDIHLFKDCLALVRYPRQVPNTAVKVDAFHFTTLLPTAPKLMLNVESDDYGIVETRSCGCALETYGFTDHLRSIRSFRKLTGEGVTLVGSDMVRILEEVLPAKFGGSPLDYQLAEEEDEQGFTRLNLFVSPKIPIEDEKEVIDTVLDAMRKNSLAGDFAQALWRQARTLRVQRKEPVWTARGKLSPLHLAK